MAFAYSTDFIFSHATVIIDSDDYAVFAVLQSQVHDHWARSQASSMKDDLRYTPSDCLETFPFPLPYREDFELAGNDKKSLFEQMREQGRLLYENRKDAAVSENCGLTSIFNKINSPSEANDAELLRKLYSQLDKAVSIHTDGPRCPPPAVRA